MTTNSAQSQVDDFVAGLSEDQAFSVIHAIRDKFGWVGTEFTPEDVRGMVTDDQDYNESLTDEQVQAVVDKVVGDYAYCKLADRLSERGNDVLADAVADAVRGVTTDGT